MFKIKTFLITEGILVIVWYIFRQDGFIYWLNNFFAGNGCGSACDQAGIGSLIQTLAMLILPAIFLLYLLALIIYKLIKFFNKDQKIQN